MPTLVQVATGTNVGNTTTVTLTNPASIGNTLVIAAAADHTITGVTDGSPSNPYRLRGQILPAGFSNHIVIYEVVNSLSGVTAVSVTQSNNFGNGNGGAAVYEISGAAFADTSVNQSTSFSSAQVTVPFTSSNDISIAVIGTSSGFTITQNNGWTTDINLTGGSAALGATCHTNVTIGSNSLVFTPSGNSFKWICLASYQSGTPSQVISVPQSQPFKLQGPTLFDPRAFVMPIVATAPNTGAAGGFGITQIGRHINHSRHRRN